MKRYGGWVTALVSFYMQAITELLEEENIQIPSWICFSSMDGEHLSSGEDFKDCLDILNTSEKVSIVGINCASPLFIETLIRQFKKVRNNTATHP